MSDENNSKKIEWTPQNIIMMVMLLVVIVLLAANLFKQPAAVQVVPAEDSYSDAPARPDRDGRGREEDPYIANQVKNTIVKGYVQIRDCYNAFIEKNPTVTDGKIMIDWTIKPDGEVDSAELVSSEIPDDDLPKCMIDKIKDFEFPPPPSGKSKYVAHKFFLRKDTGQTEEKK
jgi:hypothetical protein